MKITDEAMGLKSPFLLNLMENLSRNLLILQTISMTTSNQKSDDD